MDTRNVYNDDLHHLIRLYQQSEEHLKCGHYAFDLRTKTFHYSPGYTVILNVTGRHASLGDHFTSIVGENRQSIINAYEIALSHAGRNSAFKDLEISYEIKTRCGIKLIRDVISPYAEHEKIIGIRGTIQIITDHNNAKAFEAEISRLKNELEESQRMAGLGSWEYDAIHDKQQWSPAQYSLYEVEPGGAPKTLNDFLALVHPDDLQLFAETFPKLFEHTSSEHIVPSKFRIVGRKSGSVKHIKSVMKVYKKDGKIHRIRGINQDNTDTVMREMELQRINETLHQSKQQFERIFNDSVVGIAIATAQHELLDVNEAFCSILGYERQELICKLYSQIIAPESAELNFRWDTGERRYSVEKTLLHKNGHIINAIVTLSLLNEGSDQPCTLIQVNDITNLRNEEVLRTRNERKFRLLLENSFIGVCFLKGTNTLYANRTLLNILDYKTLDEFARDSIIQMAVGTTRTNIEELISGTSKHESPFDVIQGTFLRKTGGTVFLEIQVRPLETEHHNILAVLFVDVTSQVLARKDIEDANARLEETMHELRIASEAKENFLSIMSHEIRTPLNSVIGLSNLLMKRQPREDQIEVMRILKSSADNLMHLVNDILDFNKIRLGKVQLERVPFNLSQFFAHQHASFKISAHDRGLDFTINIDPRIPDQLYGDIARLNQIFTNLITNAIKFTHSGFVRIDAELLSISVNHCTIDFKVKDSGVGIPREKIDSIFDPFQQSDAHIAREYGGTGLGLSIVKSLVELMKGSIHVISDEAKGSQFSIILSLALDERIKPSQPLRVSNVPQMQEQRYKILYVEDVESNRFLIENLLIDYDLDCVTAESGRRALTLTVQNHYDVILMDIQMPDLDGYQTSMQIRNQTMGKNTSTPIIGFTADPYTTALKNRCLQHGIQYVITKPFDTANLVDRLKWYARANQPGKEWFSFEFYESLFGSSKAKLKSIKLMIISDLRKFEKGISSKTERKDLPGIREEIHRIKPILKNLGMSKLIMVLDQYRFFDTYVPEIDHISTNVRSLTLQVVEQMLKKMKSNI